MHEPIGSLLRKSRGKSDQKESIRTSKAVETIDDIAKRIAELENDLKSESSDESNSESGPADLDSAETLVEVDSNGSVVRVVSSLLADESMLIKPLPRKLLPAAHCASRNGKQ